MQQDKKDKKPNFDNEPQKDIQNSPDRLLVIIAWIAVLIPSSLSIILWREFSLEEPIWWPLIPLISLLILIFSTFLIKNLKVLRNFMIILLIIFLLGFGGGWQFGLIPFIRAQSGWISLNEQLPWAISSILVHLLRLTPAIVVLGFLILNKRKRTDFFLVKGDIHAMVEPSKLIGMKEPKP
jgi:hypothetical protein